MAARSTSRALHGRRETVRTEPSLAAPPQPSWHLRWVPRVLQLASDDLVPRTRLTRTRRDWFVDAIVAVGVLVLGAISHDESYFFGANPIPAWLDSALLLVAVVALFWRRRWPFEVALFVALLPAVSTGPATLVAAFALAAYAPTPRAAVGLAVMLVVLPLDSMMWQGSSGQSYWSDLVTGLAATLIAAAWGGYIGTRRQLLATLRERARRAEDEQQQRIVQAQLQERTRIAREMHDVLAHRMSLLSVHAGALEYRPDAPPAEVARAAGVIRQTAHEALEELRTVIGVLRADELIGEHEHSSQPEPPQPTLSVVPTLVADWREAGANVDLNVDVDLALVPDGIGRTAFRIVQEGLTNASKHAPATRVVIEIGGRPGGTLLVSVSNPLPVGTEASSIPGTGVGLIGLRERAALVGGELATHLDPDARRFTLRAELPWAAT